MIDAIRNEHARIYLQDQALLRTMKGRKESSVQRSEQPSELQSMA